MTKNIIFTLQYHGKCRARKRMRVRAQIATIIHNILSTFMICDLALDCLYCFDWYSWKIDDAKFDHFAPWNFTRVLDIPSSSELNLSSRLENISNFTIDSIAEALMLPTQKLRNRTQPNREKKNTRHCDQDTDRLFVD